MRHSLLIAALLPLPGLAQTAQQPSQAAQWVSDLVQGCWACGAFNTIAAIGLSFADQVFSQLASGMTLLIGLFMALWLLVFAARLLLPFGPTVGNQMWNEGAQKLFRLMLVLAFLQSSGPFWNYIFIPFMSAGMGIASQMATATDGFESQFGSSEIPPNGTIDYCAGGGAPVTVSGLSANGTAAAQVMNQMDCPLSRIQSQFAKGIVIGAAVMAQGTCGSVLFMPVLQNIYYLVAGLVLVAAFLFGYLVFPFLLIDVVMRVALVAATSPLLIAATLFKATAGMSERAIWSLAQCALTLMFGAAIGGIGKATIAYILSNLPVKSGQSLTNWQSLTAALENPCSAGLSIGFLSSSFYMLVGTAIILIFMMRRASNLASEITHVASSGTGIQAGAAFLAGQVASAGGRSAQFAMRKLLGKSAGREKSTRGSENKAAAVAGNPPT
jgi:hypothetical protein